MNLLESFAFFSDDQNESKAISSASVTLTISQPPKDKYEIEQTATAASIPGTTEQYILDKEWRTNHDAFFGEVKGRSQWISLDEARSKMQGVTGDGWDVESDVGRLSLAEVGSMDGKWEAFRIWGFEDIEGERPHTQSAKV
ncbi:MAG: hypothetical protein LQ343_007777 [Gyalolechia ehrenbergii]|nr:MAG: hypothetical protein LQ343_007777 [Gyalolechia ehrenbergii]